MAQRRREHSFRVDLVLVRGCSCLQKEVLHSRRTEDEDSSTWRLADVSACMNDVGRDIDRVASHESRSVPIDAHLEFALQNVNGFRYPAVEV